MMTRGHAADHHRGIPAHDLVVHRDADAASMHGELYKAIVPAHVIHEPFVQTSQTSKTSYWPHRIHVRAGTST